MAQSPRDKTAPPLPTLDAELFDADDTSEPPVSVALSGLLAQLGKDESGHVTVFRRARVAGKAEDEFLYECAPGEFQIADVQAEYGPGNYRILVHGPDAKRDGAPVGILANKRVTLGPSREQARRPASDAAATAESALVTIMKQNAEQHRELVAAIARGQSERGSAMNDLRAVVECVTMLNGARTAPAAPAPAADPATQGMLMANEMLKLAKRFAGGEGGEGPGDNSNGLISRGMGLIEGFFELQRQQRGSAASPPAMSVDATPQLAAPQQQGGEDVNLVRMAKLKQQLDNLLDVLVRAATNDSDPEAYAVMVYEQAPDEVIAGLDSPTWFVTLCGYSRDCAPYEPWFTKLRAAVLELVREDLEPSQGGPGAAA